MDEQVIEEFPSLNLDSIKKFLPNATLHSTDKPHSCKRMLSRLYNGIPQLKEVMDMCVRKRWSPAKLIHNSVQFQEQMSDVMEAEQI